MIDYPFGPPVEEIPLPRAPLVQVVAQASFPTDLRLNDEKTVSSIHDEFRHEYPVLRTDFQMQLEFTPEGPRGAPQPVWRFAGLDPSGWTLSLSRNFVSVSTVQYTSRMDFLARFRRALEVIHASIQPPLADRLGIRYICRIDDVPTLQRLPQLVRPEIVGTLNVELGADVQRERALTESTYRHPDGTKLLARWGTLEPSVTYDLAIAPVPNITFVLDLDVYTVEPKRFSPGELGDSARLFAERQYRFFRWAVTDEFLGTYGGGT